jgi:hypothetical protein
MRPLIALRVLASLGRGLTTRRVRATAVAIATDGVAQGHAFDESERAARGGHRSAAVHAQRPRVSDHSPNAHKARIGPRVSLTRAA